MHAPIDYAFSNIYGRNTDGVLITVIGFNHAKIR